MEITQRSNMIEISLEDKLISNKEQLLDWCRNKATFVPSPAQEKLQTYLLRAGYKNEFLFWLPPFDGHEYYLSARYGNEIPEVIRQALIQATQYQAEQADPGYVLISF